jgi:hypothetical protein
MHRFAIRVFVARQFPYGGRLREHCLAPAASASPANSRSPWRSGNSLHGSAPAAPAANASHNLLVFSLAPPDADQGSRPIPLSRLTIYIVLSQTPVLSTDAHRPMACNTTFGLLAPKLAWPIM